MSLRAFRVRAFILIRESICILLPRVLIVLSSLMSLISFLLPAFWMIWSLMASVPPSMLISNLRRMELSRNLAIRFGMSCRLVKFLRNFVPRLLAIILCLVFLIFVIPSPRAEAIAGVDDLAFVLLAALASFGITFTAAGGIEEVAPFIMNQFEDYLSGIDETVDQVASSFRFGVSKAGQFLANLPVLEYSRNLGIHIQDQFSLTDNSSISTAISFPVLPLWDGNTANMMLAFKHDGQNIALAGVSSPTYYFAVTSGNSWVPYAVAFFENRPSTSQVLVRKYNLTYGGSVGTEVTDGYVFETEWGYGNVQNITSTRYVQQLYGTWPIYSSLESALLAFDSFVSSPSTSDIIINTGSIDIPQVGDYSDQDGILIDGLGSWGDTLQDIWNKIRGLSLPDSTWPTVTWGAEAAQDLVDSLVSAGELTTENSPGFYNGLPLIGGIPDIQFGNLWHYVTDWVSSMSGGLSLIGGIMFSLPFVAAFYALVVILLVLSLWRLLRSA